jgi:hypothetical protein
VLVHAALVGCKGEKADKASERPSVVAAETGSAAPTADVAPVAANAARLASGKPVLGCLGWSASAKIAACVVGETSAGESSVLQVKYLGSSEPATTLAVKDSDDGEVLDDASVSAVNATLARLGVQPFTSAVKEITKASTTDLGGGAKLEWKSKLISKGGKNMPPTYKHDVDVVCGDRMTSIFASESEGEDPTLKVWNVADHTIIEVHIATAREGEYRVQLVAVVLEPASCTLVGAPEVEASSAADCCCKWRRPVGDYNVEWISTGECKVNKGTCEPDRLCDR